MNKLKPIILVDAVFFQRYLTGIGRVWYSLLEEWSFNGFAKHIVVIDRANTAPKIAGIRYRDAPPHNYDTPDTDCEILQQICDEEEADIFISSYYTRPITTLSVLIAYDMIPEVLGWDLRHPIWQQKQDSIQHASAYIAISQNTADDLVKFFPDISTNSIAIAHCGVKDPFRPSTNKEVNAFKFKYGITKPYFLMVGCNSSYKNMGFFLKAYSLLVNNKEIDIVITGRQKELSSEYMGYTAGCTVHILLLNDEELACAYSGAITSVYPSRYEGFGLPLLEAMACGCPVITCSNSSIPEVAGEAAIYVKQDDLKAMVTALCEVQNPSTRQSLITAGLAQATKFSWAKMANIVSSALVNASLLHLNLNQNNLIIFPNWNLATEALTLEIEQIIKLVGTHSDSQTTTLLIETNDFNIDNAEMILSDVMMSLLMQEDVEIAEGLHISLVSDLDDIQWEHLLPQIKARIIMNEENQEALSTFTIDSIPVFNFFVVG